MEDFKVLVGRAGQDDAADLRRLSIRVGESVLTRLVRRGTNEPDDWLRVPLAPLAFWFIDNWWRIRWEPPPEVGLTAEWRLAHDLSSVGSGYVWPSVSLWGEGDRLGVAVHRESGPIGSVQFLTDAGLHYADATGVEATIDAFIEATLENGENCEGLDPLYQALKRERATVPTATWRRLEAMLGFDPDDAPPALVSALEALTRTYGIDALQEAALACQGGESSSALHTCLSEARDSKVLVRPPRVVYNVRVDRAARRPPWLLGARAAADLRSRLNIPSGPIRNGRLGEILGLNVGRLHARRGRDRLPYGLRLRERSVGGSRLALKSAWSHARRFELCRTLGDIIWSEDDALGPLSAAKSERQKFQRAFAQSFLCPVEDLKAYIDTEDPGEDDIHAAARHFHVSDRMIQSTLVNNGVLDRASFEEMLEAA